MVPLQMVDGCTSCQMVIFVGLRSFGFSLLGKFQVFRECVLYLLLAGWGCTLIVPIYSIGGQMTFNENIGHFLWATLIFYPWYSALKATWSERGWLSPDWLGANYTLQEIIGRVLMWLEKINGILFEFLRNIYQWAELRDWINTQSANKLWDLLEECVTWWLDENLCKLLTLWKMLG